MPKSKATPSPDDDDLPMFARAVLGGKRTEKIEGRVTPELKFAWQRHCHALGMTESDCIDRLVSVALFGEEHVNSFEAERTRKVIGLSAPRQVKGHP